MNNKFDELTKAMAQSVTRRAALKKLGVGIAGLALGCFGLVDKSRAGAIPGCKGSASPCKTGSDCCSGICSYLPFGGKHGKPVLICF